MDGKKNNNTTRKREENFGCSSIFAKIEKESGEKRAKRGNKFRVNAQVLLRTIIAWFYVFGMKPWFISNHEVFVTILLNFSNENSSHIVSFSLPAIEPDLINYMPTTDSTHSPSTVCNFRPCLFSLSARKECYVHTNLCHEINANEMKNHAHVRITCERMCFVCVAITQTHGSI